MRTIQVVCLCPTYFARPASLVGNAIACFESQTYRGAKLIVYDDTGHWQSAAGPGWVLASEDNRHPTLSAKYNHMVRQFAHDADILIVWEDDDVYLPHHIEACVAALERPGMWAHPSQAWALTTGTPVLERVGGNMHASLAMRRETWEQIGGWPDTKRADFDLQLLANLRRKFGPPADPITEQYPPSYVFRWGSTGTKHGQSFGRAPGDEEWYERAGQQKQNDGPREVVPAWDREAEKLARELPSPR